MVIGVTSVWWELDRRFRAPLPYAFQLQVGDTGNPNATDWQDVGTTGINTCFAQDDERRRGTYGKSLTTHYRVLLTAGDGIKYVSMPVSTYGTLNERDWLMAREIVRKERLRHSLVSVEGFLLKRMRYGDPCDRCLDELDGTISDSKCPVCNGTGFKVGYHPPTPLTVDMNPQAVVELLKGTEPPGPTAIVDNFIRVLGFPMLAMNDIWVDGRSDQRWIFGEISNMAEWRHVPLVVTTKVKLLPGTDQAYRIPVGGEPSDAQYQELPGAGTGDTCIDHDYGGPDSLAYVDCHGEPIVGAYILAFTRADYQAGVRDPARAVASSTTSANGRWTFQMCLCGGQDYVLVFEKPGNFGPDAHEIHVSGPADSSSSSQVSSESVAPETIWRSADGGLL